MRDDSPGEHGVGSKVDPIRVVQIVEGHRFDRAEMLDTGVTPCRVEPTQRVLGFHHGGFDFVVDAASARTLASAPSSAGLARYPPPPRDVEIDQRTNASRADAARAARTRTRIRAEALIARSAYAAFRPRALRLHVLPLGKLHVAKRARRPRWAGPRSPRRVDALFGRGV